MPVEAAWLSDLAQSPTVVTAALAGLGRLEGATFADGEAVSGSVATAVLPPLDDPLAIELLAGFRILRVQ